MQAIRYNYVDSRIIDYLNVYVYCGPPDWCINSLQYFPLHSSFLDTVEDNVALQAFHVSNCHFSASHFVEVGATWLILPKVGRSGVCSSSRVLNEYEFLILSCSATTDKEAKFSRWFSYKLGEPPSLSDPMEQSLEPCCPYNRSKIWSWAKTKP